MIPRLNFFIFLSQIDKIPPTLAKELSCQQNLDLASTVSMLKSQTQLSEAMITELYQSWELYPTTDFRELDTNLKKALPENIARKFLILPISQSSEILELAMVNPLQTDAIHAAMQATSKKIKVYLADLVGLKTALNILYHHKEEALECAHLIESILILENKNGLQNMEHNFNFEKSPVSRLLHLILTEAFYQEASDIHIESSLLNVRVRFRVAGNLTERFFFPPSISEVLMRKLLIMSHGNISETKLPQDTRFEYEKYNIRMSTLFTSSGYSIVLRILMPASFYSSLEKFIHDEFSYKSILQFLDGRNGMMLLSGPTSSGKTSTLYASLSYLNHPDFKMITMEDPVESEIPGINQIEIHPEVGLDFSDVIRSSLRQNPDVLMLGEMRDSTSALMAMRAAITGIMVLSTIHAKTCPETVIRLMDLNVDPALIGAGLKLVVAQRLLRQICPYCRIKEEVSAIKLDLLASHSKDISKNSFYKGGGCIKCENTGFAKSPIAIFEVLKISDEMSSYIFQKKLLEFIDLSKRQLAGRTLADKALALAFNGEVCVSEVLRVLYTANESKSVPL